MIGSKTLRTWHVMGGVCLFAFAGITSAQEFKRVPPELAVGGMSIPDLLIQQEDLHNWALGETPARALGASIRVDLSQQDRAELAKPWQSGTPLRIGVVKSVSGVSVNGVKAGMRTGVLEDTRDGGFSWAMTVKSAGAQAVRLHFRSFSLPDGAELFVLNQDGQIDGPYTGAGRNGDGDFWTRAVSSGTITILVRFSGRATAEDRSGVRFVLADVGHIRGRPPTAVEQSHDSWPCSDNASCVVDANCVNGTPAEAAKDAIAKMEWIAGAFINTCSGGLLADTDGSTQIPLFLTANHCTSKSISNLETFFFYTTSSCNGSCPDGLVTGGTPPAASTVGFTVLQSGRKGDYTLGQLNQSPPAGAVFLGWTSSPIANSNGADLHRISNPNFGPQGYSHHRVDTGAGTCRGWPRGERIYSADITGATMGGSSGSPVVNSAGEVVGQLSGCCGYNCGDECDAGSNSTVDGALAFYFDSVAEFLDPQGGGGCTGDPECDDGDACNGAETCSGGACQNGTPPACQNGDGCCPAGCDSGNDDDCVSCNLGQLGDSCVDNADCCSNKCKGRSGRKTCK